MSAIKPNYDKMPVMIAGVRLPSPRDESTAATRWCANSVNKALLGVRLHEAMAKLPPDIRACVAARLFEYCAIRNAFRLHQKHVATKVDSSRILEQRNAAVGVAVPFAQNMCEKKTYPREAADIFNMTADEWSRQNRMEEEGL